MTRVSLTYLLISILIIPLLASISFHPLFVLLLHLISDLLQLLRL